VETRSQIAAIQSQLGITTVYVTHDQVEAMTMGHRVVVLKDGDLKQVGSPMELYDHHANLFVASFIGTPPMNFIAATITDGGATLAASSTPPGARLAASGDCEERRPARHGWRAPREHHGGRARRAARPTR
jgi:ABC-type sugar transport system ATPase subunit